MKPGNNCPFSQDRVEEGPINRARSVDANWPESCLGPGENKGKIVPAISDVRTVAFGGSFSPQASANAVKPRQGLTFGDLLDTINPLQHIPIISSIYRAITGDLMSPTAEIAGGALFGGIVGAVGSLADVLFTQATGKDFGDTVLSWLGFENGFAGKTRLANANNSSSPSALRPDVSVSTSDPAVAARAANAYRSAVSLHDPLPVARSSLRY
jgi:hypothetical protein